MYNSKTPIVMGSDHAAFDLKEKVKAYLLENSISVKDVGTYTKDSVDYPDFGISVAQLVSKGEFERGILICGSGIGMSMVANRFPFVRAALCNDLFSAVMSRRHNNSNILVMGGRVIGETLALEIVKAWLDTPFDGGRHQLRLNKFDSIILQARRLWRLREVFLPTSMLKDILPSVITGGVNTLMLQRIWPLFGQKNCLRQIMPMYSPIQAPRRIWPYILLY